MARYRGFSSNSQQRRFSLGDFDLIKQDLTNHFNIRRGEKLMRPTFGCGIWDYIFDPLTDAVKESIIEEVKKVIDYDPRINADAVTITSYDQGIQIELDVSLVNTNQVSRMTLRFDRNEQAALSS
jgi:uncharacterized protein